MDRRSFLKRSGAYTGALSVMGCSTLGGLSAKRSGDMEKIDIAIIGGSFAGVSAGMYAARASQQVVIFDHGKNRNRFAPTAHGLLGHDGKTPAQIKKEAQSGFAKYPTARIDNEKVVEVKQTGEEFKVVTENGKTFIAKRIILASGVSDILPDIIGAKETWGKSLLQCPYCHGYEVKNQRFGILYSGEPTLHQLKILPDWSDKLVLMMDGKKLNDEQINAVKKMGVAIVPQKITSFEHKNGDLKAIKFADGQYLERDAVFAINRHRLNNDFAKKLGCEIDEGPFGPMIKVDNLQTTTNPFVFAAGDCARAIHNSTWAISDGAGAGIFAHQSIAVGKNPYQK